MDISETVAKIDTKPSFELDFADHGQIVSVAFSPYEYSQEVILIQFPNKIIVGVLSLQVNTNYLIKFPVSEVVSGCI